MAIYNFNYPLPRHARLCSASTHVNRLTPSARPLLRQTLAVCATTLSERWIAKLNIHCPEVSKHFEAGCLHNMTTAMIESFVGESPV